MLCVNDVVNALWTRLDKPERWQALADISLRLPEDVFLRTFVEVWVDSEANDLHLTLIDNLIDEFDIRAERVMPHLSNGDQKFYASLPDRIPVFRGATVEEPFTDYSWSTDKEKATWFADRTSTGTPALIQGFVEKDTILFATNSRGEKEIAIEHDLVDEISIHQIGPTRVQPDNGLEIFFMIHRHPFFQVEMFESLAASHMISGRSREDAVARIENGLSELERLGFVSAAKARRESVSRMNWERVYKQVHAASARKPNLRTSIVPDDEPPSASLPGRGM